MFGFKNSHGIPDSFMFQNMLGSKGCGKVGFTTGNENANKDNRKALIDE